MKDLRHFHKLDLSNGRLTMKSLAFRVILPPLSSAVDVINLGFQGKTQTLKRIED